jgi:hypothetical protein
MPRPRYGSAHRRAREAIIPLVQWGVTPCCRCGHPLEHGDKVDLDHRDDGSPGYLGLSHNSPCRVCNQRCNQVAGGLKAAEMAGYKPRNRRCVICGNPYLASRGTDGANTVTCGKRECVTEIRRIRKARQPDPEPPPVTGRTY